MPAKTPRDWGTHVIGPVWIGDGTGLPGQDSTQVLNPSLVIDVKAYGAVGDGSIDDTAAIRAAITAAAGKSVYFPPGTYKITDYLTVASNTTVSGAGRASQILQSGNPFSAITNETYTVPAPGSTMSALLYVAKDATNVVIRDLYIKGTWSSGAAGITHGIMIGRGTTKCAVVNCWVENAWWSGILARGSDHLIDGNWASSNAIDGIELWGSRSRIVHNYTNANGLATTGVAGIEVISTENPSTVTDIQVIGNVSVADRCGISSVGGTVNALSIIGNQIALNTQRGINTGNATAHTNLVITDNLLRNGDQSAADGGLGHGIVVSNAATGFVVANNLVATDSGLTSGPSAIAVGGTAANGVVANNYLTGYWVGLEVSGTGANITIAGNQSVTNRGANYSLTNTSAGQWGNFSAGSITGRVPSAKGADVASAGDLTLGTDGNLFHVTGTTTINAITTSQWQAGASVTLIFDGSVTVKHNTAGGAGTAKMLLSGAVDLSATANDTLTLRYDGTSWFEQCRTVI